MSRASNWASLDYSNKKKILSKRQILSMTVSLIKRKSFASQFFKKLPSR